MSNHALDSLVLEASDEPVAVHSAQVVMAGDEDGLLHKVLFDVVWYLK